MTFAEQLRVKLRKIEALFAGAATAGERAAAGAAAERIRDRPRAAERSERPMEMRFSLPTRFATTALLILSGVPLSPISSPMPFFAHPFLVLTFIGCIWTLLREGDPNLRCSAGDEPLTHPAG